MATLQNAIDIARPILNDTNSSAYRWSDADLTQYGNDALDAICLEIPELFYALAEITCISATVNQTFADADNLKFIGILNVKNGDVVNKTTVEILDAFNPSWRSDTAGTATDWAPAEDDPNRFYIYPQSPTTQVLIGKYVKVPAENAIGATHELANSYTPAIAQYIIARARARQSGDVLSGADTQEMAKFYSMLGITKPNIIPPKQ